MTTPSAHARDLEALLLAVVAVPGDEVARFALADLACDLHNAEAVGRTLRRRGRWEVDWDDQNRLYGICWRLGKRDEEGHDGVIVGFLRRKYAPRCVRCKRYQPSAGPETGWCWMCWDCGMRIGRRARYLRDQDDLRARAAAEPILRIVADDYDRADRHATCPACQGTGLLGEALCQSCDRHRRGAATVTL